MAKKHGQDKLPDFSIDKIKDVVLNEKARAEYYEYGVEVIEGRAIFNGLDGLIPVVRRSLWSAYKLGLHHKAVRIKSAKIVGSTLAEYHPHGDGGCYDSIVNAGNNCQPMFDTKEGNWGTMTQPAAAYRYTNTRLTKYSDLVFFDPFYVPTIKFVPNYDGSTVEPLVLPALLPNALLNGNFGIAPGVNTRSPSFTLPSLIKVIQDTIKAREAPSPKACLSLEVTTRYGGRVVKSKEQRSELLRLYKTGKSKLTFDSTVTELKDGSIRINKFAPIGDIEKLLAKIESIKGVQTAKDDSDRSDPYGTAYLIRISKTAKDRADILRKVKLAFRASWVYNIKVTDRYIKENGQGGAKLRHNTPPQMIKEWLKYRLDLEREACTYWIAETEKKIAYLKLMQLAIKHIDFIVKCLKDKRLSNQQLDEKVARGLKITTDQAKSILDRPIRHLRALEYADLQAKITEHLAYKDELQGRRDKPAAYVFKHLGNLLNQLATKVA